jgi:fused signal recognition particle receptor
MRSIFSKKKKPTAATPSKGLSNRFRSKLQKLRQNFSGIVTQLLKCKTSLDQTCLDDLEALLLTADIGITITQQILSHLKQDILAKQTNAENLLTNLKQLLTEQLLPVEKPLHINSSEPKPYVILVLGINGVGKTTTIGKLAKHFQQQGKKVMLAAGDTFRAAAVEQLKIWGERNHIPVIAQKGIADSAAVIFDALESAKAHQTDILIADTAGRLHTQSHLLEELKKIIRVMKKLDHSAPHETLLILDATTGQNALEQAKQFHQAIPVTGLALTKLDGTAKGGILFAISKRLNIPIRFIGIGEQIDDLTPFNATQFVDALF